MPSRPPEAPAELRGVRVVVTRAPEQSRELTSALVSRGAEVIELPVIDVRPAADLGPLDEALRAVERYGLIVLGSRNAAELLLERARASAIELSAVPIACVGAKTRAFVEARAPGNEVLSPPVHRAEALAELVLERLGRPVASAATEPDLATARSERPPARVLFPRAAEGREVLISLLTSRGVQVDAPIVYTIAPRGPASSAELAALEHATVFSFLSGETIAAFLQVAGEEKGRALLAARTVAVIGPVAMARAEALGIRVDVVPESASIEGLVEALAASTRRRG